MATKNWKSSPEYWRGRAAEARAIADQLDDPEARAAMIAVAEGYEKIAARYEARRED